MHSKFPYQQNGIPIRARYTELVGLSFISTPSSELVLQQLAATCPCTRAIDRSSRAVYRSILGVTSLTNTRVGQSERRIPPAPIRTPEWSKANSIHTAAWHNWTRTPARNIVQKTVFSLIHLPASFIRLWPSCHFDLGEIETWLGAVPRANRLLTVFLNPIFIDGPVLSSFYYMEQWLLGLESVRVVDVFSADKSRW